MPTFRPLFFLSSVIALCYLDNVTRWQGQAIQILYNDLSHFTAPTKNSLTIGRILCTVLRWCHYLKTPHTGRSYIPAIRGTFLCGRLYLYSAYRLRILDIWCGPMKLWTSLPFYILLIVLVWSYYTFVRMVVVLIETVEQKVALLAVYHVIFLMVVWCLIVSACTRSKRAPHEFHMTSPEWARIQFEYRHPTKGKQPEMDQLKVKLRLVSTPTTGMPRYCHICEQIKPDRCCHCSTCNRCVLKMDHHCPWVANCVGYNNYKAFILLLVYGIVYTVFVMSVTLYHVIWILKIIGSEGPLPWHEEKMEKPENMSLSLNETDPEIITVSYALLDSETIHLLVMVCLGGVVIIAQCVLFSFHVNLLRKNMTTIEYSWTPNFPWGKDEEAFRLSAVENFIEVFGIKPYLWIFPVFTSLGDGAHFPLRPGLQKEHQQYLSRLSLPPPASHQSSIVRSETTI